MQHFSGICLIVVGLFDGGHIAWQLARHNMTNHPAARFMVILALRINN